MNSQSDMIYHPGLQRQIRQTLGPNQTPVAGPLTGYQKLDARLQEYEIIQKGLKQTSFNEINYIRSIVNKGLQKIPLEASDYEALDISAVRLINLKSIPDFIKYASGINWSKCVTSGQAWDSFISWYKAQPHDAKTFLTFKDGTFEKYMAPKIEALRKKCREARLVKKEKNYDTDEDMEVCLNDRDKELIVEYKRAFKAFTKPNFCSEGFSFHVALQQFCQEQKFKPEDERLAPNVLNVIEQQLRKSFQKRKGNAIKKMKATTDQSKLAKPAKVVKPPKIARSQPIMRNSLIPNELLLLQSTDLYDFSLRFSLFKETERFQNWEADKGIGSLAYKLQENEQDKCSSSDEVDKCKKLLTEELKDAVDFLASHDPMTLVANLFVEEKGLYTPPQLILLQGGVPAFASRRGQ